MMVYTISQHEIFSSKLQVLQNNFWSCSYFWQAFFAKKIDNRSKSTCYDFTISRLEFLVLSKNFLLAPMVTIWLSLICFCFLGSKVKFSFKLRK